MAGPSWNWLMHDRIVETNEIVKGANQALNAPGDNNFIQK